jgi:hypothetical protein
MVKRQSSPAAKSGRLRRKLQAPNIKHQRNIKPQSPDICRHVFKEKTGDAATLPLKFGAWSFSGA